MNKAEYLERLSEAIKATHGLNASHLKTVPVKESFQGQTVWEGDVEVFAVSGAPGALCYAWGIEENGKLETIVVKHQKPADSPENAIKAYIVSVNQKK